MNKVINIVSFDVPYPPNYGGAIDVFFKLKTINSLGIQIILHTFEYGRREQVELEKYCEKVYYYKRNIKVKYIFSKLPFIIKTRTNNSLIKNLKSNSYPILFEGLHTTYPLVKSNFTNRIILVRAHNVEHNYYKGLSKSETNPFKKLFFISEARKLLKYETNLKKATYILSISPLEYNHFLKKFPNKATYIPVFHEHSIINSLEGKGQFALYHGDLKVADNIKACQFLIDIFKEINYPLIIASDLNTPKFLKKENKPKNITFKKLTNNNELKMLIQNAHINVLPTFQNTGIKLKLINALYSGRFCLVNNQMVKNTGLEDLCCIANSKKEFIKKIEALSTIEFTEDKIKQRQITLEEFNTMASAKKIVKLIG